MFVYDVETLNGLIHLSRTGRSMVSTEIVASALVLPRSTTVSDQLQLNARRVMAAGSIVFTTDPERHMLTGLLDDLRASDRGIEERQILIVEIYKLIVDTALHIAGKAGYKKRFAFRALTQINEDYFNKLTVCYRNAIAGDEQPFIEHATKWLNRIGGHLRVGYFEPLPDPVRVPLYVE